MSYRRQLRRDRERWRREVATELLNRIVEERGLTLVDGELPPGVRLEEPTKGETT